MRVRSVLPFLLLVVSAIALAVTACGGGGFDSQSRVLGVRMFGVRADKPYAKPGETVTFDVLAADARRVKSRPMNIYWVPLICVNPRDDLYYLCFAGAGAARLVPAVPGAPGGGGGVDVSGGIASLPTGVDLGPFLPQGNTFSFTVPNDIVIPREGSPAYGLAVVFNIACAGQVRFAPPVGGSPQQMPLQCTDEAGKPLSADEYVIGINRVYSYADRTNTNPVVESVTLDGKPIDLTKGIEVERCVGVKHNAVDCKAAKIGIRVSDASWEPNPGPGESANQREQVWATYYSNVGLLEDEARLLFDSTRGRIEDNAVEYRTPSAGPATGTMWVVVHDNRAGAAFLEFPVRVK